jgi:hypothetical protein
LGLSIVLLFAPASLCAAAAIYFPQIADGGDYITVITLSNPSSSPITGTLRFYSQAGFPRIVRINGVDNSQFDVTLASMGSARLATQGNSSSTTSGWAVFESSAPVQGVASFELRSEGRLSTMAGVLGAQPVNKFAMPVEVTTVANSGFAIANPDVTTAVTIRLTLYDESGNSSFSGTMNRLNPLVPLNQVADFVTSAFPSLPPAFKGILVAEALGDGSMVATALTVKEGMLSAIPVADIGACAAPTISGQPAGTTVNAGQSATLSVSAAGSGPLIYQWYKGLKGNTSNPVSGATASTCTTSALNASASYWVRITNSCGSIDSDAALVTVQGSAPSGGLAGVATAWAAGSPPDLLGYKPFLPSSAWYTDVSRDPVDPDSANIIADLLRDDPGTMLHPDFGSSLFEGNFVGIPYDVIASSLTPMSTITIGPDGYADESDPGPANAAERVPIPVPIPADVHIEGGSDHHILLLDKDGYWLYEIYHAIHMANNSWQADQVTLWDLNDNTRRPWTWTSADQAGLSIFAGLVRYDEVQRALPGSGDIGHAIRFTVMPTQEPFIPPASHPGGGNDGTIHSLKMGQRMRLKSTWLSAHSAEFSSQCQVILRTLAHYGMILADTGSNLFIQGTRDARWVEDADAGGVAQLLRVPPDAFEVLAHSVEYTRGSHPTGLPPTIASFTATPSVTAAGGVVTLGWNVSGASTLIITPGVGPVRGTSAVVNPTATTTYTIFATNEFGRSTSNVIVTVH